MGLRQRRPIAVPLGERLQLRADRRQFGGQCANVCHAVGFDLLFDLRGQRGDPGETQGTGNAFQ